MRMTLVKIMAGSLLSSAVAAALASLASGPPPLAGSQPTRGKQTDDRETDRNDLTTGRARRGAIGRVFIGHSHSLSHS